MIGSQAPRIRIEPAYTKTDGGDAIMLMQAYANTLYEWQELIINSWLALDEKENYVVTSAGLSVSRQNGKNDCIEARELFGLLIKGERILHTAHQVKTSKKAFKRLCRIFEDPRNDLKSEVKNIRRTNGEEAIELWNGGIIEYSARSKSAARGFDGISLIIYDEAQELTDEQVEAIMATASASATGYRQIIYTGTPPYPNSPGTVFKRRRKHCLEKANPHDAWHEWSPDAESLEQIELANHQLWYDTNPSMGLHLSEEYTQEEFGTMSPDGFARERLNWWVPEADHDENYAINEKSWKKCVSSKLKPEGKTAYGVKFSADGSMVALCGAVCPENGPARISLIELKSTGRGIQWLADWLNQRYKNASCVVIDGRNNVDLLIDRICGTWKNSESIIKATPQKVIAAASQLSNEITEQTVSWYKHQEILNDSATTSIKRPISGGWGFGGENSTPIEAAALALWGCRTSKRNPNRRMRIG